ARALGLHTGSRQENASKQQSSPGSDSVRTEKVCSKKRSQLVERVKNFQPHENERCDHQIIAKMHAGLATNALSRPVRIARQAVNQTRYASEGTSPRRIIRGQLKKKGSAR